MHYLKLLTGNSWKGFVLNLVFILSLALVLIWYFYNVYLPEQTLHGETIILPSIENMEEKKAEELLRSKGLQMVINDVIYSPKHAKSSIVTQRPKALKEVKLGRKVYVDVNKKEIPTTILTADLCGEEGGLIRTDLGTAKITAKKLNLVPIVVYVDSVLTDYVYAAEINSLRIGVDMEIPINTEIVFLTGNGDSPSVNSDTTEVTNIPK
jgi:hypothetical protein